jgi:hypothetical protein
VLPAVLVAEAVVFVVALGSGLGAAPSPQATTNTEPTSASDQERGSFIEGHLTAWLD